MQRKFTPKGIEVWIYSDKFAWFPSLARGTSIEGELSPDDIDALGEKLAAGPTVSHNRFCFVFPSESGSSSTTKELYLKDLFED
jgi:hypothetical protein